MRGVLNILVILAISFSARAQPGNSKSDLNNLITRIDHVPVVVPDLAVAKSIFSDLLKFTIKNGRTHEGIVNFFVKFQDGSYLEFVTPIDTTFAIGKYYSDFIKKRAGGTSLALSVNSTDSTTQLLQKSEIPFTLNSNPVWNSIEPAQYNLFYIDYKNKAWKERVDYTTHQNQSLALKSVWWVSKEITKDIAGFLTLGFTDDGIKTHLGTKVHVLKAKSSSLLVINYQDARKLTSSSFEVNQPEGIVGFTIQVKSLDSIKQLLKGQQILARDNDLIYYLKDYKFFIVFSE